MNESYKGDLNSIETTSRCITSPRRRLLLKATGAGILAPTALSSVTAGDTANSPSTAASLEEGSVSKISADPEAGFNYPYFLYLPSQPDSSKPLVVQPVNTGKSTDDFEEHLKAGERTVRRGTGRTISAELSAPYMVPVFPRPRNQPVDGTHYVHALDDTTMSIESGSLERVDLQLLAMADDARYRLEAAGYSIGDGIILNGFSASGNFVDRFAALHPDEVVSVSAGALNGTVILPLQRADGHRLPYPIGMADVEELTGHPFDGEAFRAVERFYFYGDRDWLDTITYQDAWTSRKLRDIALDVYGRNIHTERFPYSKAVHNALGTDAVFRRYEGIGHTDRGVAPDIVSFHRRVLDGEDIDTIREQLGGNVPDHGAHAERDVREPDVGESVTLDSRFSEVWDDEIEGFKWTFDDGKTAAGETVTRSFSSAGIHNAHLTAVTESGEQSETVEQVPVGVPEDGIGSPQLVVRDQSSDGTSIVIDRIATPVNANVGVTFRGTNGSRTAVVPAGVHEDVVYPFDEQLLEPVTVRLRMSDHHTGDRLAEAKAKISITSTSRSVDPQLIDADPEAGFHYPYYIYAPPRGENADPMPVLVEMVNSGTATDDFEEHRRAARRLVKGEKLQGSGRVLAHGLSAALLVPVFPRPRTDPVDNTHYIHSLDDTTMGIDEGPLKRVDRQLLAMVEDAQRRLEDEGYPVREEIMLNGFSASGNFADRFAMLHPEEVVSVTAGGVNGMVMLPIEEYHGHRLRYHIGTADLESFTGDPFDKEAFASVNRYYFMGEFDAADTIPYADAWTDEDLRQTALDVYGLHMQAERFPTSRTVYDRQSIPAAFRLYRNFRHSNSLAENDIIRFHKRSAAGESAEDLRPDFGANVPNSVATIRIAQRYAEVGSTVAVHAIESERYDAGSTIQWDFGDGATAEGPIARHAYTEAGTYEVSVAVSGRDGRTVTASEYVRVVDDTTPPEPETTKPGSDREERRDETPVATTSEAESPGFGIGGTLAALSSVGYLLKKRIGLESETTKHK